MNSYQIECVRREKSSNEDGKESGIDHLWEVPTPPAELYFMGSERAMRLVEHLPSQGLAIVGTRIPSARSIQNLKKWISDLRGLDLIVISGFALGIDSVAHEAALAAGLPTIAVCAAGLDIDYPRQNRELKQRILCADGLFVSETPPGLQAKEWSFIRRNRLIAGWARATWVVEAGEKSGALNTARWARDMDRACFAVPCFPGDRSFAGNQKLLDDHHAYAFWGRSSLGAAWLDLAARPKMVDQIEFMLPGESERIFMSLLEDLTSSQGGIQVHDLVDWALKNGWTHQRFFSFLRWALEKRLILDENGLLLINPSGCAYS